MAPDHLLAGLLALCFKAVERGFHLLASRVRVHIQCMQLRDRAFHDGIEGAEVGFEPIDRSLQQRQAQLLAFKQRRAVLKSDLWLDEALSFAGGEGV